MITLDEAIIHAEEMAEFSDRECIRERFYGEKEMKRKCAEEHRQLAEWLKELKRAEILLKATHELLMKQNDSGYVLNLLSETVFYDEAECSGLCLMCDIENLLDYHC